MVASAQHLRSDSPLMKPSWNCWAVMTRIQHAEFRNTPTSSLETIADVMAHGTLIVPCA